MRVSWLILNPQKSLWRKNEGEVQQFLVRNNISQHANASNLGIASSTVHNITYRTHLDHLCMWGARMKTNSRNSWHWIPQVAACEKAGRITQPWATTRPLSTLTRIIYKTSILTDSVIYTQTGFFWHYTELFWNWTPILSLTRLLSLWTSIDAEVSAPGCYMSRSISFTCPGGCARTHILLSMKARGVSHVSCQLDGLELITRNVQPWAVLLLQFNQENNIYWSLYNIGVHRGSKLSRHAAQAEQAAGIQFPTK